MGPFIIIGFSPSECLLAVTFHFAMTVGEGGIGKSKEGERSGTEHVVITLREWEDRLSSSSYEHGRRVSHALQVPICRIHQDMTKRLCKRGRKIA
jgi:hypothetical protein